MEGVMGVGESLDHHLGAVCPVIMAIAQSGQHTVFDRTGLLESMQAETARSSPSPTFCTIIQAVYETWAWDQIEYYPRPPCMGKAGAGRESRGLALARTNPACTENKKLVALSHT